MNHIEDGWRNPRPRKAEKFVPIDEISPEDIAAGFEQYMSKNPEEALIAKQEREENLDHEYDGWREWVVKQLAQGDMDADDGYLPDYSSHEGDATDAGYWDKLDDFAREYETLAERHEDIEDLMDRFHLPRKMPPEQIYKFIHGMENDRSHGHRGREHVGKHQKGGDTIRRPSELDTDTFKASF